MQSKQLNKTPRLHSLDALRGFDMFWIIGGAGLIGQFLSWTEVPALVNLSAQFHHSEWNGFTFYDLIFPMFIFMIGVSLPLAMSKRIEEGGNKTAIFIHVLKRTGVLLALALLYENILAFDLEHQRYLGVLQRLALCYFFAASLMLLLNVRGQAIALAVILLLYWALMMWVPVPGFGAGVLTPEGNLAGYIDRLLIPGKMCCYGYGESEGLLSTLPSVASALIGMLAGHWMRSSQPPMKKVAGLMTAGVIALLLGLLWGLQFPINKLLWTSSYVLYAGGWSLLFLGAFYLFIDVWGYKSWSFPFVVIGMNSITIYVGQQLLDFHYTAEYFLAGIAQYMPSFETVLIAAGVMFLKWLFLYALYRKKIFLKA